jgi:GxxExxY protein
MPIAVDAPLAKLSQASFSKVSYGIMAEIFTLHGQLGRLFDEKVYQHALAQRIDGLETEVEIKVTFRDFHKSYFMDALASSGAVFELKSVDSIHQRHRAQLLNYLLLADLRHGKLVNVGKETVEHEFINAPLTYKDRIKFIHNDSLWHSSPGFGVAEKMLILELLHDWGTGLSRSLYEEGLVHLFGGESNVLSNIDVIFHGHHIVSHQPAYLCGPNIAFKVTTFENSTDNYRNSLSQFLD